MAVTDLDSEQSVAIVMGKGRRGRAVPYGAKTVDALRRYRRARTQHPRAASEVLWLGKKERVTDFGVRQMLERRAAEAGVDNVHPHRFRPTYAHTWLASGGQEQTSCGSPAGGPARWSAGTPPAPPTNAPPSTAPPSVTDPALILARRGPRPATSVADLDDHADLPLAPATATARSPSTLRE